MTKRLVRALLGKLNIGLLYSFSCIHLFFLPIYVVQDGPVSGVLVWILIWIFIYGCVRLKVLDLIINTMEGLGNKTRKWLEL